MPDETPQPVPRTHLAAGDYPVLKEVPTPQSLKAGEALVKLDYSGVCHSDVALALGHGHHRPVEPIISGHEGVGYIVALAPDVKFRKIGDAVGVKFIADTCGVCAACLDGVDMTCEEVSIASITRDGTFQRYIAVAARHLVPIPAGLSLPEAAPLLCAGISTYRGVLKAETRPGDWVVVTGAGGGLGHMAVQYALALNARVLAIDTGDEKRALLEGYGIHAWVDFATMDVVGTVKKLTGNKVAAAIVTAGVIKPYEQAMQYIGKRGTVVCLGLPANATFAVEPPVIVDNALKIVGTAIGSRRDAHEALDLAAMGKVKPNIEIRKFDQLAQVFRDLESGKVSGRVVVDMRD